MTTRSSSIPSHFESLDELEAYVQSTTLEELLDQCRQRGITQKRLAEMFYLPPNFLSVVKRSERRGHYFHFIGACKLACLYVLSLPDDAPSSESKRK